MNHDDFSVSLRELNNKIMLSYSIAFTIKHKFKDEVEHLFESNQEIDELKNHIDTLTTLAKLIEKISSDLYLKTLP